MLTRLNLPTLIDGNGNTKVINFYNSDDGAYAGKNTGIDIKTEEDAAKQAAAVKTALDAAF